MATAILDIDYIKANRVLECYTGFRDQVAMAIAAERERCAQVAEHLNGWGTKRDAGIAHHIAKVIREG